MLESNPFHTEMSVHIRCVESPRLTCRHDSLKCRACGKWVCAWHYWAGDDDLPYCMKCAPAKRLDGQPRSSI